MIRTDGIRTIANADPIPGQLDLVEEVAAWEARKSASRKAQNEIRELVKLIDDDLLAASA